MSLTRDEILRLFNTMLNNMLPHQGQQILETIIDNELCDEPRSVYIDKLKRMPGFEPLSAFIIAIIIVIRFLTNNCEITCITSSQRTSDLVLTHVVALLNRVPDVIDNTKYTVRNDTRLVHERFSLTCVPSSDRTLQISGNLFVCDQYAAQSKELLALIASFLSVNNNQLIMFEQNEEIANDFKIALRESGALFLRNE